MCERIIRFIAPKERNYGVNNIKPTFIVPKRRYNGNSIPPQDKSPEKVIL